MMISMFNSSLIIRFIGAGVLGLSMLLSAVTQASDRLEMRQIDPDKKTLCSITINSDTESQAFKKSFDPSQWNFVELATNREQGDSDFASKNCKPEIKCDVLVISGHFSGSFVGSRADSLPLKTMESLSCRSECDGVFKSPSQVFLFGCNTLSRVDSVETNPEKFLDHLLATGYSFFGAAAVIGYRTSAREQDMKTRMERLFSKSNLIVGFSQAAPTGPQIKNNLEDYLKVNHQSYHSSKNSSQIRDANFLFPASFRKIVSLSSGIETREKNVPRAPYCELYQSRTVTEFLSMTADLFQNNLGLSNIEHIQSIASQRGLVPFPKPYLWPENVAKTLQDVMQMRGAPYIYFKSRVLNSYFKLGLVTEKEFEYYKNLIINVKAPFNLRKTQLVCNAGFKSFFGDFDEIPKTHYLESQFLQSLGCVPPQDPRTVEYLMDLVLRDELKGREAEFAIFAASRSVARNYSIVNKAQLIASKSLNSSILDYLKAFR